MASGNLRYFIRHMKVRHRISMTDAEGVEVWYSYQTIWKIVGRVALWVAVVFVASLLIAAFTKVLDIVPGYEGIRSRETMIENIIKLDSLERELAYMTVYTENVAQVMEGKGPVIRTLNPQEEERIVKEKELVAPSDIDSLLRSQLEGTGRYGHKKDKSGQKVKMSNMEMLSPVKASVVEKFAPADGRYGVRLAIRDIQQVCAVQDGTVVMCVWEPEGYTIQIQHSANLLTIYRGVGQAHKQVGDRVDGGQAIGATWNEETTEGGATTIGLELWYDGVAVDPEQYLVF